MSGPVEPRSRTGALSTPNAPRADMVSAIASPSSSAGKTLLMIVIAACEPTPSVHS